MILMCLLLCFNELGGFKNIWIFIITKVLVPFLAFILTQPSKKCVKDLNYLAGLALYTNNCTFFNSQYLMNILPKHNILFQQTESV